MSDIMARARAHFAKKSQIVIPEWKDENGLPTTIYWSPITSNEQDEVLRMSKAMEDKDNHYAIRMLIKKAEDETGQKVFSLEDFSNLCASVDGTVLSRISMAMFNFISVDKAAKN